MQKLYACSVGMLVSLAGVMPASAQTESGADSLQLEEIVVTAEKRETNLQKTSISIQVYSGEDLKQEGKKRIDEIMNGVVGVQSQGSQVGTDFYMRGVGNTGGMGGGERAVAVLIDGVYQNRTETVRGGTLDVAQVEVMRGTQSTTLGASSLSGAVSLVSNQPVFEYQASGSLAVGNYNLLNTEGVLNVPLSDNQALRFAYSSNKRDGYISSGAGDSDLTNARLKYRWQVSDDLDTVFTVNHQNIGGNGVSDGVLLYSGHWAPWTSTSATTIGGYSKCAPTAMDAVVMGCPATFYRVDDGVTYKDRSNPWDDGFPADAWPNNPFRDTNIDSVNADINWKTGIGTLTVKPSYQKATYRSTEPPRGTSFRVEDQAQKTQQLDAQLSSSGDSSLTWLVGAYYYYTESSGTFKTVLFPGADDMGITCNTGSTDPSNYCYSWTNTDGNSTRTTSAYANATYPVLDVLRLTGGLRYSRDSKVINESDSTSVANGTTTSPGEAYVFDNGNRHTWSATTYSTGVEYDVLPDSMLYGKYSTGYQPGNVAATSFTKAQKIEQITLGLKNRFFENSLQLNIELFDSTYHNRSLQGGLTTTLDDSITYSGPSCQTSNGAIVGVSGSDYNVLCFADGYPVVDDYKSKGADIEVSWLPSSDDRFDVSVEYLKATQSAPNLDFVTVNDILSAVTGSTSADTAQAQALLDAAKANAASYAGLPTQNSPEWSGNFSYQHDFRFAGGSKLTPKFNVAYKSEYWSAGGPNANATTAKDHSSALWQEGYFMYNAYLTWQKADGKFTISGNVKNIENKPIMTNYGGTYVSLDAPRTFGVNFSANF